MTRKSLRTRSPAAAACLAALLWAGPALGQANVEPFDITIRTEKGSKLNVTEFDDNHRALRNFFTLVEQDYHLFLPGSNAVPGTCEQGQVYIELDAAANQQFNLCTATDTWTTFGAGVFTDIDSDYGNQTVTSDFDFGGGTLQVPNSTSLPGTCEVGDSYMDTDATSGLRWYLCETADTFVVQGSVPAFTTLDADYGDETITSDFDFTGGTLAVPAATSLPGTCTVGDSFMDTDATSGLRWYLCESTDTWAVQGSVPAFTDIDTDYSDQTVTADWSFETGTFEVPNSSSLPGTCDVGDVYMDTDATTGQRWYLCESTNTFVAQVAAFTTLDSDYGDQDIGSTFDFALGELEIPNSISLPGTCDPGMVYADQSATPSAQIAVCTAVDTWSVQGSPPQTLDIDYGDEVVISEFDFTTGTHRIPNSTSLPGTCTVGDEYMDTDAASGGRYFLCEATNTWVAQGTAAGFTTLDADYGDQAVTSDFDFGGGTLQIPNSATLPGTCEIGDQYMDTDETSGQRHFLCESSNTWVLQGGGGAGDITDVYDCTTGDCNAMTVASGEFLDGGTATSDSTGEGILLPRATDCSAATGEGEICWDTDGDSLSVGDGAAAAVIGPDIAGGNSNDVQYNAGLGVFAGEDALEYDEDDNELKLLGNQIIDGNANEITALIQGNATQTFPVLTVEDSAGADRFNVEADGDAFVEQSLGIGATTNAAAACISNDASDRLYHDTDCDEVKDGGEEFIDFTGGGTPNILDLGDDASNESIDLVTIATTGDTNSIFTEPSPDKLLIDASNNWPAADSADAVSCTDCLGETEISDIYMLNTGDTSTGAVVIDGSINTTQFIVQGAVGQTANMLVIEDSSAADKIIMGLGTAFFVGPVGVGAVPTPSGSACVANDGADRLYHDTDCDNTKDGGEEYVDQAASFTTLDADYGDETITSDFDFGGGTIQIPNSTTLPGTCDVGDQYMDTDATSGQRHYLCESTDTWALQGDGGAFSTLDSDYGDETITSDFDFGGGTLQVPNSATLPGTCEVGDSFMDTDETTGERWYLCESANTWAKQGAATPAAGSQWEIQYNDGSDGFAASSTFINDVASSEVKITTTLFIDGTTDDVQLDVQASAGQNDNIVKVEQSDSTDLFVIDKDGNATLATIMGLGGIGVANAACIANDGSDRLFHDADCDEVKDSLEEYIDHSTGTTPAGRVLYADGSGGFDAEPEFFYNSTADSLEVNSGGLVKLDDGNVIAENMVAIGSGALAGAACVSNDASDRLFHDTDCDEVKDSGEEYVDQVDTGPSPDCSGTTTYQDGEGNCDDISSVYVDEAGDTMAGDLDFNDGATDSPKATFTPQTGTAWSVYVKDSGDDLTIESASTTTEETIRFQNPGTGDVLLTFEGDIETDNGSITTSDGTITATVTADVEALRALGYIGVTKNIFDVEDQNTGDILFAVDGISGDTIVKDTLGIGAQTIAGAACLSNNASDRLFHDTDCDETKDAGEEFIDEVTTAAGDSNDVQYNSGTGVMAGEDAFEYDEDDNDLTLLGNMLIDGNVNETQLQVQGNAAQTVPALIVEDSAGTDRLVAEVDGDAFVEQSLGIGATTNAAAACISNDAADRLFHDTDCDETKDAGEEYIDVITGHGDGANCAAGEIPLGVDASGAVQGCYEPTEGDITDLDHTATAITDGIIIEPDLDEASGTPIDEDVLTYESTGTKFNWVAQSGLAAGTAAALAANGSNCAAGSYALGVDASGGAEGCTDATTEIDSAVSTHTAVTDAHIDHADTLAELNTQISASLEDGPHTTDTNANTICAGTGTYLDGEGGCDALVTGHGDGANCSAGSYPLGVDAAGAVESCTDATTEIDSAVSTHAAITDSHFDHADNLTELNTQIGASLADGAHTTDTNANTICSGTGNYLDGEGNCDPLVTAPSTEVRSMFWPAGSTSTDGTQCDVPTEATINSGPKLFTIICTDNDASTIYGHVVMPDGWDAGTVTFEATYIQTAADTSALNSDISAQCRGAGETPSSTWGTEVAIDDAAVTGSNANDHTTSSAVTAAGTCAAGDSFYWRWQLDAAGTTTAAATLHFAGFKMEYTTNIGD